MNYVIGLGEALFDCLPTGRKLGGAPANFAYHVSQFGFDSCAISAIGDDELGQEIIDTFDISGSFTGFVQGRKQHSGKDSNNRNNYQKFNQSEPTEFFHNDLLSDININ